MLFYTAITLGILIFIHELGHFLAAKLTGMRVDRFSIGFPPRAFGKVIGETDYCISWIPIGGYVKIAGMIDESFDTDFLSHEPQPWEFRARPMWARMVVISAGVIMNILLAIAIFWGINYAQGKYVKETTEIGYVVEGSPADKAGLLTGDQILSINGKSVSHWDEVQSLMYIQNLGDDISLKLRRGDLERMFSIPRKNIPELSQEQFGIYEAHASPKVEGVVAGMPAERIGLHTGDIITALDGRTVFSSYQVVHYVRKHAGDTIALSWKRSEEVFSGKAAVTAEGRIGINIGRYNGPFKRIQYSIFEAFPEGITDVAQASVLFYKSITQVIAGKVSFKESFGGPIKIAQLATQSAEYGLISYLGFMALLSMSLAILNILPIPALDGGHLALLLYEKIFHREIPHKVKIAIQQAGFILLLVFMAFVIYNDISNF